MSPGKSAIRWNGFAPASQRRLLGLCPSDAQTRSWPGSGPQLPNVQFGDLLAGGAGLPYGVSEDLLLGRPQPAPASTSGCSQGIKESALGAAPVREKG